MPDTAATLRRLRLARAWSQEQLGDIAGLSVRTIQRLETGHAPSLETMKALAAALGVSVVELHGPERDDATFPEARPMCSFPLFPSFRRDLIIYGLVIASLAAFNLARNPDHLWFVWPALGWGAALAIKGWKRRHPRGDKD